MAWEEVALEDYGAVLGPFDDRVKFDPRFTPPLRPAIVEPKSSVTVDLSPIFNPPSPTFAAAHNAVNVLVLLAVTQAFSPTERLLVLGWQHPSWWFRPHQHAVVDDQAWPAEVFPMATITRSSLRTCRGNVRPSLGTNSLRIRDTAGAQLVPTLTSWLPIKRSRR
jgi:Protein of unknown function (DUF2716)